MATEVTRILNIDYDNCNDYLIATNVSLHINLAGTKLAIRHYLNGKKYGNAQLNSAAMEALFPSDSAKPFQLDFGAYFGELTSSSNNWIELRVDDQALKRWQGSANETSETFTGSVVESMTKSSVIQSYHNANSTVTGTSTRYLNFTLHFWQYTCLANTVGNGVKAASIDKTEVYDGDTITFSAELYTGATWHGWYSDVSCTNLVSSAQSYSVSPNADITLYAKATIGGTPIYLKQNGAYTQANAIYKKVNGVWTATDKTALDTTTKYKIINT